MATTDISTEIVSITGVSAHGASDEFIVSAQKSIVASIPKELLKWAATLTSPASHGGNTSDGVNVVMPTATDSVLDVSRNGFSASEVPYNMKGFIANTASLQLATDTYPKYYFDNAVTDKGVIVIVKPIPTDSETVRVLYVDYTKIDDDSDLREAVVYRASSNEFDKLASSKVIDWSDLTAPVPPESPSFTYSDVSVSDIVQPIINVTDMASAASPPTYTPPVLSVTSFPTLTWTFPSVPVKPVIQDNSISFSTSVPTFTPPVMNAPDFSDTNTWISTEEDSEMLAARVQEINAKVGEYGARMNEAQAQFNKENAEYQAQLQISIQDAQLSAGDDNQRVQKFSAELNEYNSEVNKVINGNNAQINEWQSENNINIQKYANDVNNNLNVFNASNVEYQQDINKKTQNFQKEVQQAIQNAQQEFATRKAGLDTDVQLGLQNALQNFQASVQEYGSKIQRFGSELQKYQAETGEKSQKVQTSTANANYYSTQSKKYYEWSVNCINMYIQNNSKMINRTMAAQQQAAQQRR